MALCAKCFDDVEDEVICGQCSGNLHYKCSGLLESTWTRKTPDKKLEWRCQTCRSGGKPPLSPTPEDPSSMKQLLAEMKTLTAKVSVLGSLPNDIKALKDQYSSLQEFVKLANDSIAEFSGKIKILEGRMSQLENAKKDQVIAIQTRLDAIEDGLNEKEQWSRMSNVEIKGVPQSKNENLFDVVTTIGKLIQFPIQKMQLNFVTRIPTRDSKQTKPIIVCFNNRYVKEDFIAAARITMKKSPITASALGFTGNDRIFVNDHLTFRNKTLLTKAKKVKEEKGFQYLWAKHCKIFLRKTDTSPIILIKSEKDLIKLTT
ncbi:hypothetical protein O0L34_g17641 [Tuta absoluta]|nr:hypothetical protein O0L34_g17641 [Tuta absoluta]